MGSPHQWRLGGSYPRGTIYVEVLLQGFIDLKGSCAAALPSFCSGLLPCSAACRGDLPGGLCTCLFCAPARRWSLGMPGSSSSSRSRGLSLNQADSHTGEMPHFQTRHLGEGCESLTGGNSTHPPCSVAEGMLARGRPWGTSGEMCPLEDSPCLRSQEGLKDVTQRHRGRTEGSVGPGGPWRHLQDRPWGVAACPADRLGHQAEKGLFGVSVLGICILRS